jgi:hypothetical protein
LFLNNEKIIQIHNKEGYKIKKTEMKIAHIIKIKPTPKKNNTIRKMIKATYCKRAIAKPLSIENVIFNGIL